MCSLLFGKPSAVSIGKIQSRISDFFGFRVEAFRIPSGGSAFVFPDIHEPAESFNKRLLLAPAIVEFLVPANLSPVQEMDEAVTAQSMRPAVAAILPAEIGEQLNQVHDLFEIDTCSAIPDFRAVEPDPFAWIERAVGGHIYFAYPRKTDRIREYTLGNVRRDRIPAQTEDPEQKLPEYGVVETTAGAQAGQEQLR